MLVNLIILCWILSGWLSLYIGYKIKDFHKITLGMVFVFSIFGPGMLFPALYFSTNKIVLFQRK